MPTPAKTEKPNAAELLTAEFKNCLGTMSYARAGWDYDLPPAQRAEEGRQGREALSRARAIWAENPDRHDDLRQAFKDAAPLATMCEIENVPTGGSD